MKAFEVESSEALSRQTWISATFILVFTALVSKALGFVRDILVAQYFGAGAETDAFMVAVTPATLAAGIGSAIATALVPVYRRRLGGEGLGSARRLAGGAVGITLFGSLGLMLGLLLFPRALVNLVAPSLPASTSQLAADLTRWLVAVVFGLNMIYVLGAVYNALEHFKIPAFMDLGSNICVLASLVTLAGTIGIHALALGLAAGTLFVVGGLALPLWSRAVIVLNLNLTSPGMRELAVLGTPVLLLEFVSQTTGIVENFFGARLEEGSISALGYAKRVSILGVSLVAVNIARAVFPVLSRLIAEGRLGEAKDLFIKLIRQYLVAFIPLTIWLAYFGHEIVRVLFMRGAFDSRAANTTSDVLVWYAAGTILLATGPVCIRTCYAFADMLTPLLAAAASLITLVTLSTVLTRILGVTGIALSTTLSLIPGVLFMGWRLRRRFGGLQIGQLATTGLLALLCSGLGLVPVIAFSGSEGGGKWGLVALGGAAAAFLTTYAAAGWFVMRSEVRTLWILLRRGY